VDQQKLAALNPAKPKLYASEIGHLGAINAPGTQKGPTLQTSTKHSAPECPHKTVHRSGNYGTLRPPSMPQGERTKLQSDAQCAEHQSALLVPKKNLSIKIPEMSPSQAKTTQFKSLSTKHSDGMQATNEARIPPLMAASSIVIPNHEPAKCSIKKNGVVRAYAANTNQGLVR